MAQKSGIVVVSIIVMVGLVAAIGATVFHSVKKEKESELASKSGKAVMCNSAEYKETCLESVRNVNSSDPKEVMRAELEAVMGEVYAAIKGSASLMEEAHDNMTRQAIDICLHVLEDSMDTLKMSFDRVPNFDPKLLDEYVHDLKIWVSGVVADRTVCMEGFRNTRGDFGLRMEKLLDTPRKLTVTALDMINQLDNLLGSIRIASVTSRRLLGEFPGWVGRRLLEVNVQDLKPDVVVASDGTGDHMTINEALMDIPNNNLQSFVIYVKEGVYEEQVEVLKHMTNLVLAGDGPEKTKITASLNYADGVQTYNTATVSILGNGFIAKDIGFENKAGARGQQAVALGVQGDKAMFFNCRVDGYRATLYAQKFRQFYRDCTITGTLDFILGDAAAAFQNCHMVARNPGLGQSCIVTAQGKDARQEVTGMVLHNCVISGEPAGQEVYLGRPWKKFATVVIIQSQIDGIVNPAGWDKWRGSSNMDTCYFAEFGNRGQGAGLHKRVSWKGYHKIDFETAQTFVPANYILGDTWIPQTAIPYYSGWMNV